MIQDELGQPLELIFKEFIFKERDRSREYSNELVSLTVKAFKAVKLLRLDTEQCRESARLAGTQSVSGRCI